MNVKENKTIIEMVRFLNIERLPAICFIIGIYMKQFYFLKSGSFQIGDFFLILSFIISAYSKRARLSKNDVLIYNFILISFFINISYSLIYSDYSFIVNSSYYVYSLFIIIIFRNIFKDEFFAKNIVLMLKFSMITQLFIYMTGQGKYYGFTRYEGTFNDPNQFAFYVLASFYIIWLYSEIIEQRLHLIWYFVVLTLISISASTGMMMCFSVFVLFRLAFSKKEIFKKKNKSKNFIFLSIFSLFIMVYVILSKNFLLDILVAVNQYLNTPVLSRIIEKISKFSADSYEDSVYKFLRDRNMVRVLLKPERFLFGSGEGGFYRFLKEDPFGGEIHSTAIGLWYYYGIIPYILFLKWIKKNLEGIDTSYVCVYIALIIEAFTLANHRQPLFWMLLILGSHPVLQREIG